MARKERKPDYWPCWYYGPNGEAEIFDAPAEVPEGWQTTPFSPESMEGPSEGKKLDRFQLMALLKEMGVKVNPLWPASVMEEKLSEL